MAQGRQRAVTSYNQESRPMKTRFLLICFSLYLAAVIRTHAQEDAVPSPLRSQEELDQLLGPIALYPDALIALILPACTVPSDVVLAARYLRSNGDTGRLENESWDDSVKSLSHYPEVVKWMDENLAWTKQAGEAFVAQPADVMNAIQRLRAAARAAGTLADTPQQRGVMEDDNITIVPADPEVIYVPRYDPEVVYISRPGYYHDPFLTFGIGFSTGVWLGYDFDWGRHRLWTIDRRDRERYWREHREREWRNHDWHGSPRVGIDPSHSRSGDDHFRHEEWHPRRDVHRPSHVSGGVVRNDSNHPDNSPRYSTDQRNGRSDDQDHKNDGHRGQRGQDSTNNGKGRPNSNNNGASPTAVKSKDTPPVQQPTRTEPARSPGVANPGNSPQPAQTSPRQDRTRTEREARGNSRATQQNPQARPLQSQTRVQPKQSNPPNVVSREARAPQSQPQAVHERAPAPVQSRVEQSPPPSRQSNDSSGDRKDRDDRRDRPQR